MGQVPTATGATSAGCKAGLVGEPDAVHGGGQSTVSGALSASVATAACNAASGRGCGSGAGADASLPVFQKLREASLPTSPCFTGPTCTCFNKDAMARSTSLLLSSSLLPVMSPPSSVLPLLPPIQPSCAALRLL
ncbi:hypothetical protein Vafri_5364 [Volvox africanus]|nr:hypothetical protein Vafri_5364 [Volvox africanus]